jgi:hypothetical protein
MVISVAGSLLLRQKLLNHDSQLADWLIADQHIREISGFDIKGPAHLGDYQGLSDT